MLEIASQMILCLLLAALLGFIIGYLFGKGTCTNDDCGHEENTHTTLDTHLDHTKEAQGLTATTAATSSQTIVAKEASIAKLEKVEAEATEAKSNEEASISESPMILSAPRNGQKDNLTRIKGIGLKIEEALNGIGIYHFDQIAAWDAENIAWADSTLGFPGRAEREQWVVQAHALSLGEETEFSKRVDKGEVSTSKQS